MAAYDVDDFSIVYRLCSSVKTEEDWDDIRVFLRSNPTEVTKACAEYQGELETSSLHVACKHNPPLDVIQALYEASPETVEWIDAFVWLPLHYAAANGASAEVLSFLTNADPTSKVAVDKRGRTPLHFAVGTLDRQASKEVVEILSDSGAARCADENGSLPIHYACAYSSSVEVLKVLVEAVPQSSSSIDFNGCTPLHFAVSASYFGSNSISFCSFLFNWVYRRWEIVPRNHPPTLLSFCWNRTQGFLLKQTILASYLLTYWPKGLVRLKVITGSLLSERIPWLA